MEKGGMVGSVYGHVHITETHEHNVCLNTTYVPVIHTQKSVPSV